MDKLREASKKYFSLSFKERTHFLEYLIFRLSIAGRAGYTEANVDSETSLNYLKGVNEVLHVISQQLLTHRSSKSEDIKEEDLFNIALDAFEMYAMPQKKMPMSFLDILYMAFRDILSIRQ